MKSIEETRSYYNPTPYVNYNPAAQNLLGNFFGQNAAALNATRYANPQYQAVPNYGGQVMIPLEAQQAGTQYLAPIVTGAAGLGGYALSQLNQNGLLRAGTGATLGGVAGRTAYPLALFAASRFGTPALKAVNAVANSPVGKWGAKFLDAVF